MVNILCEESSSEVWGNQCLFFLNKSNRATIYNGLPPSEYLKHGLKSTQIPYRWNEMYNDKYELMHKLLAKQEEDFDYVHALNGHTIFHHWEVPNFEANGEHGRWVPARSNLFFSHTKSHFDRFPYIFDFNNPLLPKHELLSRRHNLLQAVICGEPEIHACAEYDLSMEIRILASKLCNTKIPLEPPAVETILNGAKVNFADILRKNFPLKIIHIAEICRILNTQIARLAEEPKYYGEVLAKMLIDGDPNCKKTQKLAPKRAAKKMGILDRIAAKLFGGG
jgi:hypothetical protein